jgi:diguanylate cyclase (GGDEF)-like protein
MSLVNSDRLRAIIDLQNEIAEARPDLESVMQVVVDRAAALSRGSGAVIELVEGEEMVYRAAAGTVTALVRLARRGSLSGRCVEEARPLRSDDTSMHHAQAYEAARRDSQHDPLTDLLNRRSFDEILARELARRQRYGHPMCLALFDVDRFKALNDRHGHAAGDDVLRALAGVLRHSIRACDVSFRLGGDELALLLPDTSLEGAQVVVARCVAAIEAARLGDGLIGVSVGIAEAAAGETARALYDRADALLYADKRATPSSGRVGTGR